MTHTCNALVIGGGPGGYVAAIRLGQAGIDTMLVDADGLGGTCLHRGCIPSKALIHAADEFHHLTHATADNPLGLRASKPRIEFAQTQTWKDGIVSRLAGGVEGLLKKAKVRVLHGHARFVDGKTVDVKTEQGDARIHAANVVIAAGSLPVGLSDMPFGGAVLSSTEALKLEAIPKTLAVVGAGYIGLELGIAYAKLGAKVTVVEFAERILPIYDKDLTHPIKNQLAALGVKIILGAKAEGYDANKSKLIISGAKDITEIDAEKVLVTVGRKPNTEKLGLENLVLDMDGRFIRINDQCRTNMAGIYAIGDVTGEPMLAHRAMAQGELVADVIAGKRRHWDKRVIPAICFTDPEIVSVGLTPEDAAREKIEHIASRFPFAANGRALTMGQSEGFIRVLADKQDHVLLGVQAVGGHIAELASTFATAIEMGARLEDIGEIIHAHPTLGEAFHEASLGGLGHMLHL